MANCYKIFVFVPVSHADGVRQVIGEAGAGAIGNYTHCTFSTRGIGRFKLEAGANPTIGEVVKIEEVEEERIETICTKDQLAEVIAAIKKVHPYEEPPIDVLPMEDFGIRFGGQLKGSIRIAKDFDFHL